MIIIELVSKTFCTDPLLAIGSRNSYIIAIVCLVTAPYCWI